MSANQPRAGENTYLYETHLHTSDGSLCASVSAIDQVRRYHALGYTGIVVTDHFFSNGSCPIPRDLPWEEMIRRYYIPYETAKAEGDKIGLNVFFGIEHSYHGNDFLIYGLTREWMLEHPHFYTLPPIEFLRLVRGAGAVVVHAHPYRRAAYIDMIRLLPDEVDGVEIFNACRPDMDNELARVYAEAYGLVPCGGSDNHHGEQKRYGGIISPRPLTDEYDLAQALLGREISILRLDHPHS